MPKLYCILLYLLLLASSIAAPFPIRHIGINQGLSNSSVRCIFQDKAGFMWFGTYDGLNRYDGYSFKTFRNLISDSTSLPHNYINAIGEDFEHNLVVGTAQGVSVYNSLTQQFAPGKYIPYGYKEAQRIPFNVNGVRTDNKGNLYMTTGGGGLMVKENGADTPQQVECVKNEKGEYACDAYGLVIDPQQRIWFVVAGVGLCQYTPATKKTQVVNQQTMPVRCMESDDAGNIWIATYDGLLYQYNIAQATLTQPYREQIEKIASKSILDLSYDVKRHQLWIGTEGNGIYILNTSSGAMDYLLPGEGENVLSSETVYDMYEDREHRKWIGTHKGGIDIIEPQQNPFQTISHDPLNHNSLINNFVASFYEDSSRNLWIGTDGGGVSFWDRGENQFTQYKHQEGNQQSLSNNSVPSIQQDYLGNIWMATFGGGINRLDKSSGTFKRYACIFQQTGGENNYVWKLLEDRQHNLWATTYSNGHLYRLNRGTDKFEPFSSEFIDLFCLMDDGPNTLWGGTAFGLCQIDKNSRKFSYFDITKPVRSIFRDTKGRYWIGTEGLGLILFDKESNKIIANYTTVDGLCNNAVLNILEDAAGNLWLSTFHGLSQFNPATKTFKNYYGEDGLQSNQFEYNAALRLHNGEMVFGGINGFNLFHPAKLQVRNFNSPVVLTNLRINNTNVAEGSAYVKSMQADGIAVVSIPFNEASLSFDFAALEYTAPGKIAYAYYLEGWDKGWNYTNTIRTANYTRLSDGKYTLHIKATNAEGVWNPQEVQLKVIVLPPWYRSWWAYLLYTAILVSLIYLYNAYRVRRAHLETEVKLAQLQQKQDKELAEKEKELAQLEIQKEKELAQLAIQQEKELADKEKELAQLEIQKEKELAEKKLTFFTDVSHELRTPLTLIISPLKDYLESDQPQDKRELTGVYRNARRLLTLVDQLLQFRKAGEETDNLRIVKLNFCQLCQDVFASFENAARRKQLIYHFTCNYQGGELYADREKMEVILYNLLSNAVKFTPDGGEISMSVTEKGEMVEVKLTDNGQGIPPDVGNKLFERFYRVEQNGLPSKPGFGIGLYLVKHFVEKHSGEVTYESKPEVGTTFCLTFKKGTDHFGGLPVYEEGETVSNPFVLHEPEATRPTEPGDNGLEDLVSSQKTILIVEDNNGIREYVSSIFKNEFIVQQASGGNEGIRLAKQYLPDIIISDIMMDGGNGIELCRKIKSDASLGHIPVILLTAVSDSEIRLKGTESGADDYITKPFEKELLVARVNALLKNRTKLQQYFFNEVTLKKQDLKISAEYKEFLDNCIAIIERHLDDESFNIKKLSQEIGMSHSSLFRKVKSVSGQSIAGFIRFIRLRKAAELMISTDKNVNEISYEVGIIDVKYFRKQFNALFGMNPSDYIKKYREAFIPTLTVKRSKKE